MRTIIKTLPFLSLVFISNAYAQQNAILEDTGKNKSLNEVVVTGQYQPQSLKNSVYQVRVVNHERIRLSGATSVQQVLNNQLGFRFSNDNATGTIDVQLMGVSGRNVKILLDGVPMVDRGDTRESLNQIDINTIDRIEIVEGPMSVSYGSDALAGTINIITTRNKKEGLTTTARIQEETAGNEYYPGSYKGVHQQSIALNLKKSKWNFSIGGTHTDHNGFGGDTYGRSKTWKPKEQWLGNARLGYSTNKLNIYYRVDALNENIVNRGPIGQNYKSRDQRFLSDRYTQQLQSDLRFSNKLQLTTIAAYTDYKRKTKTTTHDFQKNTDELSTLPGDQDLSKLNSLAFRNTLNFWISQKISLQPGIDINRENASGERISGNKSITDYAFFISSEIKPTAWANIRPGIRIIKNTVYDAPPVIPSINTKFILNKELDLRLSYGYGFRSPALRELYFSFVDANHNLVGNPALEAEHSNSFNGSLSWSPANFKTARFTSALGGFYNSFYNQINLVQNPTNINEYSYYNIDESKSAGVTLDNRISYKALEASLGFAYTGYSASFYEEKKYAKEDDREFLWTPEINSNIIYNINRIKTSLGIFYKFIGAKPAFTTGLVNNQQAIVLTKTAAYNLADVTATTIVNKYLSTTIGVKNLFDVTNVVNNAGAGSIHNNGSSVAIGYGRSYFIGLNFQWNKK